MAKLTMAQRTRLDKLATYLEGLPADYSHFNVRTYFGWGGDRSEADYARNNGGLKSCGTSACAVGHGPAAGILVPRTLIQGRMVNWNDYAGLFVGNWDTLEYDWAFHDAWDDPDGSHYGAAARIRYMLEGGVPAGFCRRDIGQDYVTLYAPYRIDAKTPANA